MLFTSPFTISDVMPLQALKTYCSIEVMPLGNSVNAKFVQPEKALFPIKVKPLGNLVTFAPKLLSIILIKLASSSASPPVPPPASIELILSA